MHCPASYAKSDLRRRLRLLALFAAFFATAAAAGVHLGVRQGFLDNMDERSYVWLADRLLEGRVTAEPVPEGTREHFRVLWRNHRAGRLHTVFPVGWPALLSVGRLVGLRGLVNPVLVPLCLLLVYRIVSLLYRDEDVALRAVLVLAPCPLLIFQAGTLLSHVATCFWILLGLYSLLRATDGRGLIWSFVAGLAFGFAASTRPLDALAVAAPAGLAFILHQHRPPPGFGVKILLILGGGVLGLMPFIAYNAATTGNALLTPQQLYAMPDHLLARSPREWLSETLPRTLSQLDAWRVWAFPFLLVVLGYCLLLGRRFVKADAFCMILAAVFLLAYSLNVAHYDIAGPRYLLFVLFPSSVLLARASTLFSRQQVFLCFAVLLALYLTTFRSEGRIMYRDIAKKRGLDAALEEAGLERAIVFIPPDKRHFRMGARDLLDNEPDFSGVIFALDLPATNAVVSKAFPGVPSYRWPSGAWPGRLTRMAEDGDRSRLLRGPVR